MIKYDVNLHL